MQGNTDNYSKLLIPQTVNLYGISNLLLEFKIYENNEW